MNVHVYLFPDQNLVIQLECVMKAFESVFPIDTHTHTPRFLLKGIQKCSYFYKGVYSHTHTHTLDSNRAG